MKQSIFHSLSQGKYLLRGVKMIQRNVIQCQRGNQPQFPRLKKSRDKLHPHSPFNKTEIAKEATQI